MKLVRACELCNGEATLYCSSDSAYLCWNCDAKVHEANFLVARHVRCIICSKCKQLTDNRVSGVGIQPRKRICLSCSPPGHDDLDSSSSSACISTAESSCATPMKKKKKNKIGFGCRKVDKLVSSSSVTDLSSEHSNFPVRNSGEVTSKKIVRGNMEWKAEGVLVNWCRKLEVGSGIRSVAVPVAVEGFGVCSSELTVLPSRVSLAASLWLGLRFCEDVSASTWQVLKRLQDISGVPAKLILAAESKLARVLTKRRTPRSSDPTAEEGSAESSV